MLWIGTHWFNLKSSDCRIGKDKGKVCYMCSGAHQRVIDHPPGA